MSRSCLAVCALSLLLFARATEAQTTREVSYNPRSDVRINAKLRFTTMIILPESEQILDFVCGDKEFWVVSGTQNLAYVKPAKAGASSARADADKPSSTNAPHNKPTQRFMIVGEPSRKRAKRAPLARCPKAPLRLFLEAPAARRGSPSPPKTR